MVYTFLSWGVIGISVLSWGYAFMRLMGRVNGYNKKPVDMMIVSGLCLLTVYAEVFSLFYKVGMIALSGVLLVALLVIVWCHKDFAAWLTWDKVRKNWYYVLVVAVIGIFVCALASGEVTHYDTYLYHAQAIHWIEDYGVVLGLGNLHMRLAYNSSFLCLQTLFSFKFLLGQSFHSMNGFIVWFMLSYAVCSMKCLKGKKVFASDFLRLAILLYYVRRVTISSPETDMFAMGLAAYIFTKWVSLLEDSEEDAAPYAYLSILALYGLSLKLSVAMVVLLAIKPACRLLAARRWKEILLYIALGMLVLAPFIVRNVVISGYLLYPYPEIDLFSADWKMPAKILLADRNEIKSWGMGRVPVDTPFSEWFPAWEGSLSSPMRMAFWASILSAAVSLIAGVVQIARKRKWDYFHVTVTMASCFLLWFYGAPLFRYGEVFLTLLPLYLAGTIFTYLSDKILKRYDAVKQRKTGLAIVIVMVLLIMCLMCPVVTGGICVDPANLIKCADYDQWDCQEIELDGLTLYIPSSGDQAGYHAFPSRPSFILENPGIQLRGDSVEDGFRWLEK